MGVVFGRAGPRDVPPMFCLNVQTDMNFYYISSCLHILGIVKISCQFPRPSKTSEARRVVSQPLNQTEICLDPIRNALQYMSIG